MGGAEATLSWAKARSSRCELYHGDCDEQLPEGAVDMDLYGGLGGT